METLTVTKMYISYERLNESGRSEEEIFYLNVISYKDKANLVPVNREMEKLKSQKKTISESTAGMAQSKEVPGNDLRRK